MVTHVATMGGSDVFMQHLIREYYRSRPFLTVLGFPMSSRYPEVLVTGSAVETRSLCCYSASLGRLKDAEADAGASSSVNLLYLIHHAHFKLRSSCSTSWPMHNAFCFSRVPLGDIYRYCGSRLDFSKLHSIVKFLLLRRHYTCNRPSLRWTPQEDFDPRHRCLTFLVSGSGEKVKMAAITQGYQQDPPESRPNI